MVLIFYDLLFIFFTYLYKTFQIFIYKVDDFLFEDRRQNKANYKKK